MCIGISCTYYLKECLGDEKLAQQYLLTDAVFLLYKLCTEQCQQAEGQRTVSYLQPWTEVDYKFVCQGCRYLSALHTSALPTVCIATTKGDSSNEKKAIWTFSLDLAPLRAFLLSSSPVSLKVVLCPNTKTNQAACDPPNSNRSFSAWNALLNPADICQL